MDRQITSRGVDLNILMNFPTIGDNQLLQVLQYISN